MLVRWIAIVGGLLLVLGGRPVLAQSGADALFHEAARQYVDGERTAARQTVDRGLELAPSDPRLLALQRKLEEDASEQQGSGQSGQSGQSNTETDDQSGGEQQRDDPSEAPQEDTRSRSQQGAQSQPSSPSSSQDAQASSQDRPAAARPDAPRPRTAERAQALSRAQANRLLQALEAQEKQLLREVRMRSLEEKPVEKDW